MHRKPPDKMKTKKSLQKELLVGVGAEIMVAAGGVTGVQLLGDTYSRYLVTALTLLLFTGIGIYGLYVCLYVRIIRPNIKLAAEFASRSSAVHRLDHDTRNLCVRILGPAPKYGAWSTRPFDRNLPDPLLLAHKADIVKLLERTQRIFSLLAPPGAQVWVCLRDLRGDGCYHTFARAGDYDANRERFSKPLDKEKSATAREVRQGYFGGECVVLTGQEAGPHRWDPELPNNSFNEDRCVLMGAIAVKSPSSTPNNEFADEEVAWILGVCSDKEDAFNESHFELMKGCIDTLGIVANLIWRQSCANSSLREPANTSTTVPQTHSQTIHPPTGPNPVM